MVFAASLWDEFQEIVNSQRVSCKLVRGEWCVPVFKGIERRKRKRLSQEVDVERATTPADAQELDRLQADATNRLTQFGRSIADVALPPASAAPEISARPEDMPQLVEPRDQFFENIGREVRTRGHD